MMAEIAEKEIKETEEAANKKCQKSRANTIEEEEKDDDYDNFVSFFNTLCNLFEVLKNQFFIQKVSNLDHEYI